MPFTKQINRHRQGRVTATDDGLLVDPTDGLAPYLVLENVAAIFDLRHAEVLVANGCEVKGLGTDCIRFEKSGRSPIVVTRHGLHRIAKLAGLI